MTDIQIGDFFHALNIAALEMKPDGRFLLLGDKPDWLRHFCGDMVSDECYLEPGDAFGFLESFLETAKEFWKKETAGCKKSGIWIEEEKPGQEYMYEAMAIRVSNKNILIISQDQCSFKEKQTILQKSRELALDYHVQQRAKEAIQQHRDELEDRVRERTEELEQANFRLAQELTARKQIETERAKIIRELQQSQKMEAIGTLAGGIAHDFNNILSAVIGFTELAIGEIKPDSPTTKKMNQVLVAAERAKKLVKQILKFSHQAEEEAHPIQVKKVVQEALTLIRASLPAAIELKQDLSTDACILADSTQLHQVVMNLCTNAAQSMPKPGGIISVQLLEIEVTAETKNTPAGLDPGAYVRLMVKDTGCGMPPEILDRVFDPFFTTKEKGEGTGMGLSLVHGIVKSYGGNIFVDSLPGKGAAFQVFLPAIEETPDRIEDEGKPAARGDERILFVDDEPLQTELAMNSLGDLGYHVTVQTDSMEALERFREFPDAYDLVITDLTMPKMTGVLLSQEMLAIRPNLPIILCSGYSKSMSRKKALDIGIQEYLMKPVALKDLANAIRRIMDQR